MYGNPSQNHMGPGMDRFSRYPNSGQNQGMNMNMNMNMNARNQESFYRKERTMMNYPNSNANPNSNPNSNPNMNQYNYYHGGNQDSFYPYGY